MNHSNKALSRVLRQYRSSPKYLQWIQILPLIAQQYIETPLEQIINALDINNQTGEMLSIIGRIVGARREQYPPDISENIYRMLIKARIAKNNSVAEIDDIDQIVRHVVDVPSMVVIDHLNMSFSIIFNTELSADARYLLTNFDAVPRPQGVKFAGFTEAPKVTQFGGTNAEWGDADAEFGYLYGGS